MSILRLHFLFAFIGVAYFIGCQGQDQSGQKPIDVLDVVSVPEIVCPVDLEAAELSGPSGLGANEVLVDVSVTSQGVPWVLSGTSLNSVRTDGGTLWRFDHASATWSRVADGIITFAAEAPGKVWATKKDTSVIYFDAATGQGGTAVNGNSTLIYAGHDGDIVVGDSRLSALSPFLYQDYRLYYGISDNLAGGGGFSIMNYGEAYGHPKFTDIAISQRYLRLPLNLPGIGVQIADFWVATESGLFRRPPPYNFCKPSDYNQGYCYTANYVGYWNFADNAYWEPYLGADGQSKGVQGNLGKMSFPPNSTLLFALRAIDQQDRGRLLIHNVASSCNKWVAVSSLESDNLDLAAGPMYVTDSAKTPHILLIKSSGTLNEGKSLWFYEYEELQPCIERAMKCAD